MICQFALDDGAYVLGALGPAERSQFERHMSTCGPCRDSVAALAVLPGLLGRLDASTAAPARVTVPPTLLPRVLAMAAAQRRKDRRRRRWQAVAVSVAAALLAAVVGIGVHVSDTTWPDVPMTAMRPASQEVHVTADIGLQPVEAGTRVYMICRYPEAQDGRWVVRLVVFPTSGVAVSSGEQVATWTITSGHEVSLTALTHLATDQIGRVELQRADETTLLTWTPA